MTEVEEQTINEVQELIQKRDLHGLGQMLKTQAPQEIAGLLDELPANDDVIVFRLLSRELAKETYQLLSRPKQHELLEELAHKQEKLAELLNDLDPDDRTALLEELPGKVVQKLLQMMDPQERKVAVNLLGYPPESIGRLMTPGFVSVRPDFTVAKTLEHIRKKGKNSETLNVIYVTDKKYRLIDDLRIREILLAEPDQKISDLMDHSFVSLRAFDDQETAISVIKEYDRIALPVVDDFGILLGIVTVDDVLDVAEEEATEDFHKFGSIQNAVFNPLKATVGFLYRKRISWLFALVLMNILSGAAISLFEDTIAVVVSLVFFLPLLIGSGGNAGAQSAT